MTWQPIETAPRSSAEEILATDYDSIEIISWEVRGWTTRDGMLYCPALWQSLPDVPELPELEVHAGPIRLAKTFKVPRND